MLRVGRIEYANCTPLFHVLQEQFSCRDFEFVKGVPANLNKLLLAGEIDVCPSSSIEYAYHSGRYKILPQLSISSIGSVASVLLFSKFPIEELDGKIILLSSESATSVNLLKILLNERFGCLCSFTVAPPGTISFNNDEPALLLIGDSALRHSYEKPDSFIYDLGELWYSWTGLPFVFALWLCRAEVADHIELKNLALQLIEAKKLVSDKMVEIASVTDVADWMGQDRLLAYWRDNISYQLDEVALSGLVLYYRKCYENGLITSIPELHFVSP